MKYTPNFQNARIIKRCEHALNWVNQYVSASKAHWLSQREIQRQFGSLSRPLANYLKHKLLICVNDYYSNIGQSVCRSYKLNVNGYNDLCSQIGFNNKIKVNDQISEELATGEFAYKNKGHREYHSLQNLPRRIKKPFLSENGYRHEYDIQCSVQTLVLQHARQLGFKKPTAALDLYIENRSQVRADLSDRTGLSTTTVKQILAALFNGASLSSWYTNQIFSYVNYNKVMIKFLRDDSYIQQYLDEVRSMWRYLRKYQGLSEKQRFDSKRKSKIYRQLEESVREVIKKHLRKTKNKAFIEHDGWSSQQPVDIERLCWEVRQQTGLRIRLDWTIYE